MSANPLKWKNEHILGVVILIVIAGFFGMAFGDFLAESINTSAGLTGPDAHNLETNMALAWGGLVAGISALILYAIQLLRG